MALTKVPSNLDATVAITQSASDNSTNVATTAYVDTAITNLIDGAPGTLNTLDEIAAALNDDAALNTTLTTSIATKLPLAGGTVTGTTTFTGGDGVVVQTSSDTFLQLKTTGSGSNYIEFKDSGGAAGNIRYNHSTNILSVKTNGTDNRLVIDASGNVGIGETSPDERLHVSGGGIKIDGDVTMASNEGAGLFLGYSSNVAAITALDQGVAWKSLRLNAAEHQFYIAGGLQAKLDASGNFLLGAATANDQSASMGGQTPDLYVPGYTSLGGLRIQGTDTGNTLYKTGGPFGLTIGDSNMITLSNSNSTARLNTANWEVLSGGSLRAYRTGNSAYAALFMDTGENLYIRNSWGMKDLVFDRDGNLSIGTNSALADGLTIRREGSDKRTLLQLDRPNTPGLQTNIKFSVSNIMVGQIQHEYVSSNYNHMSFTLRDPGGADVIPLWLENSGNVGIGTTTPLSDLHVEGNIAQQGTASKSVSSGTGDSGINLYTLHNSYARGCGRLRCFGTENNLNCGYVEYFYVYSYYSPNSNYYVNLKFIDEVFVSNTYGRPRLYLYNSSSYNNNSTNRQNTDQSTNSTNVNILQIGITNVANAYGTFQIVAEPMHWNP